MPRPWLECGCDSAALGLLSSEKVQGAARRRAELIDHMGIDHRRLDVGVPQVLLNLQDVDPIEEQWRGDAVPQRVDQDRLMMRAALAAALSL